MKDYMIDMQYSRIGNLYTIYLENIGNRNDEYQNAWLTFTNEPFMNVKLKLVSNRLKKYNSDIVMINDIYIPESKRNNDEVTSSLLNYFLGLIDDSSIVVAEIGLIENEDKINYKIFEDFGFIHYNQLDTDTSRAYVYSNTNLNIFDHILNEINFI